MKSAGKLRHLPREIADARQTLEHLHADIATRDAHDGEEFVTLFVVLELIATAAAVAGRLSAVRCGAVISA